MTSRPRLALTSALFPLFRFVRRRSAPNQPAGLGNRTQPDRRHVPERNLGGLGDQHLGRRAHDGAVALVRARAPLRRLDLDDRPHPGERGLRLEDVVTLGQNDAWAVGWTGSPSSLDDQSVAMHWDGTAWSIVPTPQPGGDSVDRLLAVDAAAPNDVWATGLYWDAQTHSHSVILHWDGTSWRIARPGPPALTTATLAGCVPDSRSVTVVAGQTLEENFHINCDRSERLRARRALRAIRSRHAFRAAALPDGGMPLRRLEHRPQP